MTPFLPKELIPIGRRAAIDHVLRELVESGIRRVVLVISPRKEVLRAWCLLRWADKLEFRVCVQRRPDGLASALCRARRHIDEGPCLVALPDNVFFGRPAASARLLAAHRRCKGSVVGLLRVDPRSAPGFGNSGHLRVRRQGTRLWRVTAIGSKGTGSYPLPAGRPRWRGVGRMVVLPSFFEIAESIRPRVLARSREFDDVPVLRELLRRGHGLWGYRLTNAGFDVGNPLGLAQANRYARRLRRGPRAPVKTSPPPR